MTTESISFIAVFNKYILYSEAMTQYYSLEEDDRKIVEPYVRHLKELWQLELQHIKIKLQNLPPGRPHLTLKK